jgi:hypothetical protein
MAELEIGDARYRTGRLNVFEQISVVKRIGPLLSGMGEAFGKIPQPAAPQDGDDEDAPAPGVEEAQIWSALNPLMEALSSMKDEDLHFVVKLCLSKAQRFDGGRWARLMNSQGTDFMFGDTGINVALQIAFETVRENLDSFFGGPRPETMDG